MLLHRTASAVHTEAVHLRFSELAALDHDGRNGVRPFGQDLILADPVTALRTGQVTRIRSGRSTTSGDQGRSLQVGL